MAQDRFLQRALYYCAYTALGSTPLFYGVKKTSLARASFAQVTGQMKYSGMELLLNAMALVKGKVVVLDVPFGLRDYSSETTRDPERVDPATYLSVEDLIRVREVLIRELRYAEPSFDETIRTMAELFITQGQPRGWVTPRSPHIEPAWIRRMKLAAAILESFLAPKSAAARNSIPENTMRALMHAHSVFSRNSGK